ncbi:MAG: hypothetical protein MZU95_09335 [Desulfomicrobium escambiense]|nr:hypothetical protein [Desulfomicrobium escambiense]
MPFGVASVIGPLLGGFFTEQPVVALDLLHQPAVGDRRVPRARHRAAPSGPPGAARHRLAGRRAPGDRRDEPPARDGLGRPAVRLGVLPRSSD